MEDDQDSRVPLFEGSRLYRPPSYKSEIDVPATPSRRIHDDDDASTPTAKTYKLPRQRDLPPSEDQVNRNENRTGRGARRLTEMEIPVLRPQRFRPASTSPKRLYGARELPMPPALSRSISPDTAIRMPLQEKHDWIDDATYHEKASESTTKAYSIASDETEDEGTDLSGVDLGQSHYGPAPSHPQPRRGGPKTKTEEIVSLTHGNLVIDQDIPKKLLDLLARKGSPEFTQLRYTAITCDPDEFLREGFNLRPAMAGRETELLICLTMYNEDERLFTRSLHGVMKNIAHLSRRSKSRTWGASSWKKIVVVIVADGRRNIHPRVLDVLTAIGVYQDGLAQNKVEGRKVQAHLYEHTSQFSMTPDLQFRGSEKGIPPVQIAFLMKETNQKKLNSHRWLFNGLGPVLNPSICVLLDVGTRPGNDSIYHLWKAMDNDSRVAGCAGEIRILKGKAWSALLNPLVASQNFEYKISNILDKPMESVFGFIQVLPGAFSAYRYMALSADELGRGPLESYFKGEHVEFEADVLEKNMYLAEDRILAFELIAKRESNWLLKYVSQAYGETDCPNTVSELIGQRRRWLNGAFFAATFALYNWKRIWYTSHSRIRKAFLHLEFLYFAIQLVFTFLGLANFYLTFFFITQAFGLKYHAASYIFVIMRYLCIMVTAAQFILALGNRPKGAKSFYLGSLVIYTVIMAYTLFCTLWLGVKSIITEVELGESILHDRKFANLILSAIATTGIYLISSLLHLDVWHMLTSFVPYMLLLPFYLCTLTIFAFCNLHDVSWGTKEEDVVEDDLGEAVMSGAKGQVKVEIYAGNDAEGSYEDALTNLRTRKPIEKDKDMSKVQEDYFKEIRSRIVLFWLVCNLSLMMAVSEYYDGKTGSNVYLSVIMYSVVLLTAIRFAGSILYLIIGIVQKIGSRRSASDQMNEIMTSLRKKFRRGTSKGL